jgi:hypothetical protein
VALCSPDKISRSDSTISLARSIRPSKDSGSDLQAGRVARRITAAQGLTFTGPLKAYAAVVTRADPQLDAWPLAERLSPMGDKRNERQIRELLPSPAGQAPV